MDGSKHLRKRQKGVFVNERKKTDIYPVPSR